MADADKDDQEIDQLLAEMAEEDEDFAELQGLLKKTGASLRAAEKKADEAMSKVEAAKRESA
jgi:hypothetical protein